MVLERDEAKARELLAQWRRRDGEEDEEGKDEDEQEEEEP
jgi:hypothetical protein